MWWRQCESLYICVDTTLTHTVYLKIAIDNEHPVIEMVFPDDCGFIPQDNASCQKKQKMVQEGYEKPSNELLVSSWPQNYQIYF